MKITLLSFIQQIENQFLQALLARFAIRQISTSSWKSSELVDCATAIMDEVRQ